MKNTKQLIRRLCPIFAIGLVVLVGNLCLLSTPDIYGQSKIIDEKEIKSVGTPERSGGSYNTARQFSPMMAGTSRSLDAIMFPVMSSSVGIAFEGFGYLLNWLFNDGGYAIPPDPIAAAGPDQLIAVVNRMIEMRDKTGSTIGLGKGLKDFFSPLGVGPNGTLDTYTFDPKVTYDHYADRFLVVTLEKTLATDGGGATDESRILLAVSRTATPTTLNEADWYFHSINSKIDVGGVPHWADYPGFEVDEEVIYITNNLFTFNNIISIFGGVRLWIVHKVPFYSGGSASGSDLVYDPYTGGGYPRTTMPAQVFGAGGIPGGWGDIGTFLVSYGGLTIGTNDIVQVVQVDDPTVDSGGPVFTLHYVSLGSLEDESYPALPDAPQLGSSELIEVNDRRALDAVWRDSFLWFVTTIYPESGPDVGQATAHWVKMNTSLVPGGTIYLVDQGNIGGEDIAPGTTTFFPSIAVNSAGNAQIGFSASAPTIYAGAYVAGRHSADPAGTVRPTQTVKAGEDVYHRTFSSGRNRWGDYSGISLDPADDRIFWVYNEFADESISGTGNEDGAWGTAYASVTIDTLDVSPPANFTITGPDVRIPLTLTNPGSLPIDDFVLTFNYPTDLLSFQFLSKSGTLTEVWPTVVGQENTPGEITITCANGTPLTSSGVLIKVVFQEVGGPGSGSLQVTGCFNDLAAASTTDGTLNDPLPVELASFSAQVAGNSVKLKWITESETNNLGFDIEKGFDGDSFSRIGFVSGQGTISIPQNYIFTDNNVDQGTYYYRLKQTDSDGSFQYSESLKVVINRPISFNLFQNHPNPFNPETIISYQLPQESEVYLAINNLKGQEIRRLVAKKQQAGSYDIVWNGKDNTGRQVASGVYVYRIRIGSFTAVKKLTLLR